MFGARLALLLARFVAGIDARMRYALAGSVWLPLQHVVVVRLGLLAHAAGGATDMLQKCNCIQASRTHDRAPWLLFRQATCSSAVQVSVQ